MKIVTYNIQFGLGKDGHNDLERIAKAVNGADIIVLQEVERNWRHSDLTDQPEKLAGYLPGYYWVYGPYFDVDASRKNPDGTISNTRRQFGNMVLAKTPILSSRLFPLPKSAVAGQRTMAVGMLEAVVCQGEGRAVRIYNTHLSAKSSTDRLTQIERMCETIKQAPTEGNAWTGTSLDPLWSEDKSALPMPEDFILMGDFNHGPNDLEYARLTGADSAEDGLFDCWTQAGNAAQEGATYYDTAAPETGRRIDFAFVDKRLKTKIRKTWVDGRAQGSDHQPYWLELDRLNAPQPPKI